MDSYLDRLQRELRNALAGTSPAGMEAAPAGKWSAAQILEHLFLTYRGTHKGLLKCLEKGASLATGDTFRSRVRSFIVCNLGYFPSGRKAPERATPRGMPPAEVLDGIFTAIEEMDRALAECEKKFGADQKVLDHPVLGPFSVRQWRKFHWVHGRHHLGQIRERIAGAGE